MGEDGHPRKVQEGEDPNHMGLVLEWVYGTIVSTAEKARDGAKRPLGTPLAKTYTYMGSITLACISGIKSQTQVVACQLLRFNALVLAMYP